MDWKESVLTEIETKLASEPIPLPELPTEQDRFLPVSVKGKLVGAPLRVFGTWRGGGAGYRVIAPLETDGRRVMVDLGVAPQGTEPLPPEIAVTGNLDWPDETGRNTPAPDGDLWFSRDVPAMAAALKTEPVLVVARKTEPTTVSRPAPVGTEGIPNNHLGYAIQWFGLAIVWAGMTLFLAWRIRQRTI
jgi:surfeit locus 1 family protein